MKAATSFDGAVDCKAVWVAASKSTDNVRSNAIVEAGNCSMKKFIGIVALLAVAVIFVGLINLALAAYLKISRDELGIQSSENEGCVPYRVRSFWRMYESPVRGDDRVFPDYNGQLVADYFGIYAAYAANAYRRDKKDRFSLTPDKFEWISSGDPVDTWGGMYAEIFYRRSPTRFSIMVVFRGTDKWTDWISNAGYFTQMFNPWDQYRAARNLFMSVRTRARAAAAGMPVEYLAVGHSLGGGLARHLATAFPCTSAIVFNSSFVSNDFRLAEPFCTKESYKDKKTDGAGKRKADYCGQIVDIFEDRDFLSKIALLQSPADFFEMSARHQWYRARNIDIKDLAGPHGIYNAARAMARIPIMCLLEQKQECELTRSQYGRNAPKETPKDPSDVRKLFCVGGPSTLKDREPNLCR